MNLDRDRSKTLGEKFDVDGIPSLVVLSPSCEKITSNGVSEIRAAPNEAVRRWLEGKSLFWSREAREGEYVWEDTPCTGCHMNPLIGSRHGCTNRECDIDLCETCLTKNTHEHPLVEYLLPKKSYSLEEIFKSVPHLLNPNNEEKIETKTLWEDGVKSFVVYFSDEYGVHLATFLHQNWQNFYKELQESCPYWSKKALSYL